MIRNIVDSYRITIDGPDCKAKPTLLLTVDLVEDDQVGHGQDHDQTCSVHTFADEALPWLGISMPKEEAKIKTSKKNNRLILAMSRVGKPV